MRLNPPKTLQILVSSPSDVRVERELCRKIVAELQRDRLRSRTFQIRSFFWEDDLIPGIGADAQAVVNDSLAQSSDGDVDIRIVVCILSTRIGTKTRFAASGTVEEVVRALLDTTAEAGRLLLYVSDRPVPPSAIDTLQLDAVRRFLEAFRLAGGLHAVFSTTEQFESMLRQQIRDAVDACDRAATVGSGPATSVPLASALPFQLGDSVKDFGRSLIVEVNRLSAQAAVNLEACADTLAACAGLSQALSSRGQEGLNRPRKQLELLTNAGQHTRYSKLDTAVATLRAVRVFVAFGTVLADALQPLRVELAGEASRLILRLRPLIDTVIGFCNTVMVEWPAAEFPLEEGSTLGLMLSDLAPLRDLESEVEALDRALRLSFPAGRPAVVT